MKNRIKLHNILVNSLGTSNVYFQPPESLKMKYPCVRYEFSGYDIKKADNKNYLRYERYTLQLIVSDPESELVEVFNDIQGTVFDRPYIANNLYHFVYTIFI